MSHTQSSQKDGKSGGRPNSSAGKEEKPDLPIIPAASPSAFHFKIWSTARVGLHFLPCSRQKACACGEGGGWWVVGGGPWHGWFAAPFRDPLDVLCLVPSSAH
jgi:hypothetical protein